MALDPDTLDVLKQLQSTKEQAFPWADLYLRILSAFLGAFFAFAFAIWLTRRDRRGQRTLELISEFSSPEMLLSRFVTVSVADRINAKKLRMRDLALSMVQDCPTGFTGKTIDGLTEHQHISHLVGWFRRLSIYIEQGWIDEQIIAITLGGSLQVGYNQRCSH